MLNLKAAQMFLKPKQHKQFSHIQMLKLQGISFSVKPLKQVARKSHKKLSSYDCMHISKIVGKNDTLWKKSKDLLFIIFDHLTGVFKTHFSSF